MENGKGAISARSVRPEDIDRITGLDKTTHGKGEIYEYGNIVTYSYDGTKITYTSTNGCEGEITSGYTNNEFHYYNGEEVVKVDLTTQRGEIAKIKCDYYECDVFNLTGKSRSLLQGDYWLARIYVNVDSTGIDYIVSYMNPSGYQSTQTMWYSNGCGVNHEGESGVRVVVALSPDIELDGSSETGWTY